MHGALVACFGCSGTTDTHLTRMAARLLWHRGRQVEYVDGPLRASLLVDDRHGPTVERTSGRTVICHGATPRPISELQKVQSRFAALEWDGRVLTAIRDPLGEVPLFYRTLLDTVWFATEIPALAALGRAVPDIQALTATATGLPYPERTGWEGILRVLPGEIVEFDPSLRCRRRRYWDPAALVGLYRGGRTEALEDFRSRFEEAVRRTQGRSTGILLSGGLDSSAVAVVAARQATGEVTLLSVGYESVPEVDESRYAEEAAAAAGLPLRWVPGHLDRWDPRCETTALGVPTLTLPTGVYDTALPAFAGSGCDVVLDGQDGDGVLGYPHATVTNTLLDLDLRGLGACADLAGWTRVARVLASEALPPWFRMRRLRGRGTVRQDEERLLPYFRGEVRARYLADRRWRPPRRGWRHRQARIVLPPFTQGMEELEAEAARCGVDIRHPFADRDLVEFLLSLPHSLKHSPLRTKPILRDALDDLLPETVRERPRKTEFSPLIDRRVDYGACRAAIEHSGIRFPGVDYDRLFAESDPSRERCAWFRLARAHVFAAGAAP